MTWAHAYASTRMLHTDFMCAKPLLCRVGDGREEDIKEKPEVSLQLRSQHTHARTLIKYIRFYTYNSIFSPTTALV